MRGHESDIQYNFAADLATKNQFVTELLEFPTGVVVLIARSKTQFFNTSKVNKSTFVSLSRRKILPLSSAS